MEGVGRKERSPEGGRRKEEREAEGRRKGGGEGGQKPRRREEEEGWEWGGEGVLGTGLCPQPVQARLRRKGGVGAGKSRGS